MAAAIAHEPLYSKEPSVVSLLSGWVQQGMQSFFAVQRILLDLAMQQNASVMHAIREQLSNPRHSPIAILSEVAGEGMDNFLEGQKVLLELGRQQNEILMTGVKQQVGDCPRRHALVDLVRRSVDTFIKMQEEYLKIAGKQTHAWMLEAEAGQPYHPEHLVNLAREGMDNFIKAQKQYLDIVAEETTKITSGKGANGGKKMKHTELSALARQATESFVEAQKRLVDVAGRQMAANVKTAGKTMELMRPFPFLPLTELTREAVKSYADAQKALMNVVARPANVPKPVHRAQRPVRKAKRQQAVTVV